MPIIVWAALAIAVLIIGGSIASSVPEITDKAVPAVAQSTGLMLAPIGWGIAVAIVLLAIMFGIRRR